MAHLRPSDSRQAQSRPAGSGGQSITKVEGRALPLRGADIDTDRIMPARFLVGVSFEGLEKHVFEDDRKAAVRPHNRHPFDVGQYQGAKILVVNSNFGCGSSREHAPQGLHRWGIDAVIGESFAEIFFGNSVMIGMPCVTAAPADVRALMELVEKGPAVEVRIDLAAGTCEAEGFRCAISMPANAREALMSGAWDTTGMLLDHYEQVNAAAARLPYVSGF
jgi:3-isopropylmalate/(R)-2-methylmalate dehydratase small subunit